MPNQGRKGGFVDLERGRCLDSSAVVAHRRLWDTSSDVQRDYVGQIV